MEKVVKLILRILASMMAIALFVFGVLVIYDGVQDLIKKYPDPVIVKLPENAVAINGEFKIDTNTPTKNASLEEIIHESGTIKNKIVVVYSTDKLDYFVFRDNNVMRYQETFNFWKSYVVSRRITLLDNSTLLINPVRRLFATVYVTLIFGGISVVVGTVGLIKTWKTWRRKREKAV